MTNEDFERRMEFFLEQQAQAFTRLDRVDQQIEQLVGFAGTLRDALLALTHHIERHDQQLERNDQQIAANEKAIAELVAQGKKTDARLNTLSVIVERHISGHQ